MVLLHWCHVDRRSGPQVGLQNIRIYTLTSLILLQTIKSLVYASTCLSGPSWYVLLIPATANTIQGYTELIVQIPNAKRIPTLNLHCRQGNIKKILVNNNPVTYDYYNYMEKILPGDADPETYRVFYKAAQDASDDGELSIHLPQSQNVHDDSQSLQLKIRIDFELYKPTAGVYFVMPDTESYPNRTPRKQMLSICHILTQKICMRNLDVLECGFHVSIL